MPAKLPLVVTGTIIPQASFVFIQNWQIRRNQYLESLLNMCKETRVFFLENSTYDLENDSDFRHPNLSLVKLQDNESAYELGKGFQEFRMLDAFLDQDDAPQRFIKLSGRRTLKQLAFFQRRYAHTGRQWFDLWQNDRFCDTSFFCCDRDFYRQYVKGLYREANDAAGRIIEHVLYDALEAQSGIQFHPITPLFSGQHGTSGNPLKDNYHIPSELRRHLRRLLGKTKLDKKILDL